MKESKLVRICKKLDADRKKMLEAFSPQMDVIEQMHFEMGPIRKIAMAAQRQTEAFQKLAEPIRQSMALLQQQIEPFRDMIRQLLEQHQQSKEHYRKAQAYLFEEGWYLGGDMSMPNYKLLSSMVNEDQHQEIEVAMCSWAKNQVDKIAQSVKDTFPGRAYLTLQRKVSSRR